MKWLAGAFGCFVSAVGILALATPETILEATNFVLTSVGLYVAAAVRIVFGSVLMGAARASRMPRTIGTLGALMILVGLALPFIGVDRLGPIVGWWSAQGPAFMRAWAVVAVAFGAFIVFAVTPRREAA